MIQHADPTIELANFGVAQLCTLTLQNNWMLQQLCSQARIANIPTQENSSFSGLAAGGGMPGYIPNWPQQAGVPIGTQLNAGEQGTGTGRTQQRRAQSSSQSNTKTARGGQRKDPKKSEAGKLGAQRRAEKKQQLQQTGMHAAE